MADSEMTKLPRRTVGTYENDGRDRLLEGKAVVITGAARGLGQAYARAAASCGANLVLNDCDAEQLCEVGDELTASGAVVTILPGDVSHWDDAKRLVGEATRRFGKIDGLVSNAGVFHVGPGHQEDPAEFKRMLEVNVLGVAYCGIHAMDAMIQQGSGSIVNVTSGAHLGMRHMSAYGASKGAVASLTYTWAMELLGSGVRVNGLSPLARTRMSETMLNEFDDVTASERREMMAEPEANAPTVVYLLSDLSSTISGQILRVDHDELSLITPPKVSSVRVPKGARSAFDVDVAMRGELAEIMEQPGI